ncbi:MAG: cytochrome-c peroxidase [Helicobacteraceae bacterium]|nr:cytochrome-c peroxidase [Helicobacteraceae bacterium]
MRILIITFIFLFSNFLFAKSGVFENITPIPDSIPYDKEKAALGKRIYLDKRFSKDGTIACASCHGLDSFGVDNLPTSPGVGGALGDHNSPTSFNAAFNFVQFWNGRAPDLVEQAKGPFLNPVEMAMSESGVVEVAKKYYESDFKRLYGEVSFHNVADSVAEFEKTLITPNSPFDRYLKGDERAISQRAKEGYAEFRQNGCISCHQGVNIGGNMYQKFGIFKPYPNTAILGRYAVTNNEADKMVFKVPSLRNIAKTAPYFHDGSTATLEIAVQLMAYYQLGKFLDNDTTSKIVEFLETLTGEVPNAAK